MSIQGKLGALRTPTFGPETKVSLLADILRLDGDLEPGRLASRIGELISLIRDRLPECSAAVVSLDSAANVVGIEASNDVGVEVVEQLATRIDSDPDFFKTIGLVSNGIAVASQAGVVPYFDHAVWTSYAISESLTSLVVVWRDVSFGAFAGVDISQIEDLADHIALILRMWLFHDSEKANCLSVLLNQCGMAFIVVDEEMNLVQANPCGEVLVDAGGIFSRVGDQLQISNAMLESRFRRHIVDLLAGQLSRDNVPMTLPLQRDSDATFVKVVVVPLRTAKDWLVGKPVAALVMPQVANEPNVCASDLLNIGFTKAESELLLALLEGKTIKEYARIKGRAVPTVRAHLKRAMMRVGVHRQADLVRVLLTMVRR